MSVRVLLDKPHSFYTNLDIITGKVILNTLGQENISAIVVKLEGECHTRLAGPPGQADARGFLGNGYDRYDRNQTELEVHKLLYKVVTVFPSKELQQATLRSASYTLPAGSHEYPFQFKIPFNNNCAASNTTFTNLHVTTGRRMEIARDTSMHVKKTLPPTLSGFPDVAEVFYFVKATVQRAAFYKENYRSTAEFKFFPIEPPRSAGNGRESYARRQHQFSSPIQLPSRPSIFRKQSAAASEYALNPPAISIDSRLPDPAIVTCNECLPLRIIIKKLNDSPDIIYLQLLQLELIGYTAIRAHQYSTTQKGNWLILSLSNLQMPLTLSTQADKGMEIDKTLWSQIPLPNTVAPSFETCNLSRYYEFKIKIGLGYGQGGTLKPEVAVHELSMPVKVYSGIAPPATLIARMAEGAEPGFLRPQKPASFSAEQASPSMPYSPPAASNLQPHVGAPAEGNAEELPPPSYEDAIAEDIAPVDGPRRDYHQPEITGPDRGEKGNGLRRNDERLFP